MRRKTRERINAKCPLVAILLVYVLSSLTVSAQAQILCGVLLARSQALKSEAPQSFGCFNGTLGIQLQALPETW